MKSKAITAIMLTLFLASIAFTVVPVRAAVLEVGVGYPYPTIAAAIVDAGDGDTILVHSGTYGPFMVIGFTGLTIKAYGVVNVTGVQNVTTNYGPRDASTGTIVDCTVSPNTFGDMNSVAIGIWDGSEVTIDSCIVKDYGRIGVFIYNGCTVGIYDSTLEGQVYDDVRLLSYGIEVEIDCQVTIEGNKIYNHDNTVKPTWRLPEYW